MARAKVGDGEFVETFERLGAAGTARALGMHERSVHGRRVRLERRLGREIVAPALGLVSDAARTRNADRAIEHPQRHFIEIENGVVMIGSDAHYWPKIVSTAHRAFVKFAKKMQPKAIILNGDVFDGASVSRHPSIGWENKPSVISEIEACTERLGEIQKAAPNAVRVWTLGNHDARFETRLANAAPEYARVHGVHLKDHFPFWHNCWSCWINPDDQHGVVIKHRFKGGIHATHNNTVWAGRTMITGHLHSLKATPFSDYNGLRWGIDTGTLAEPDGPQFMDYSEDAPKNHRSGFVALFFKDGRMLQPQLAIVCGKNEIDFMGNIHDV